MQKIQKTTQIIRIRDSCFEHRLEIWYFIYLIFSTLFVQMQTQCLQVIYPESNLAAHSSYSSSGVIRGRSQEFTLPQLWAS